MSDARLVMKKGSVSFYMASRILPSRVREAVTLLYQWCRYCDDVIDGQQAGQGQVAASRDVDALLKATTEAVAGKSQDPVFGRMGEVVRKHEIPMFYAQELLAGMRMDVDGYRYQDLGSLKHYCYRVAGTVGLMFTHISGVSRAEARRNAQDLGIAMQMTNIARDVAEDFYRGRIYLPGDWLEEEGVDPARLMSPIYREGLVRVVGRLLDQADTLYRSGDVGLGMLPFRGALAVATARHIYAEIGVEVRKRRGNAWNERVVVPLGRKVLLAMRAFIQVAGTLPARWVNPWKPAALPGEWRLS